MERKDRVILIVEDELPVRKLVSEILQGAGYEVVSASSGPDALKAFNRRNGTIGLLITDVDLAGGMSGVDVAQHLMAIRPHLKVVMMSGSPREFAFPRSLHFIRKPFAPADLLQAVEDVLADQDGTLFRKDCRWIERLLSRRYPRISIECENEHGNHYVLRLRLRPESSPKEVRFSLRDYLEGNWENKIETAVDSLLEAG